MKKKKQKKRADWQLPGAVGQAMAGRGGAGAGVHGGGKKRRNRRERQEWKRGKNSDGG